MVDSTELELIFYLGYQARPRKTKEAIGSAYLSMLV